MFVLFFFFAPVFVLRDFFSSFFVTSSRLNCIVAGVSCLALLLLLRKSIMDLFSVKPLALKKKKKKKRKDEKGNKEIMRSSHSDELLPAT